jgi:hypothetical protein
VRELDPCQQFHDQRSTTIVRMPGSSGDSVVHRESTEEDVKVKLEPGIEASAEDGSPLTLLEEEGSTDRPSARRSSVDVKEEDLAMELEMKPHPPTQVPSGTPAGRDASQDSPDEDPRVKAEGSSPKTIPPVPRTASSKKTPKSTRHKLKVPGSDMEDRDDGGGWTDDQLELIFYRKELQSQLTGDSVLKRMRLKLIGDLHGPITAPSEPKDKLEAVKLLLHILKEAGFTTGAFDANALFDMDLTTIEGLVDKLAALIGISSPIKTEAAPAPSNDRPRYHLAMPIPDIAMPVKPEAV